MQACHPTASCHQGTARTLLMLERFILVDRNENLQPLVVAPLLEVSSAEDISIDGSLARHLDSSPSGIEHCGQHGLFWDTVRHAPG